MAAQPNPTKTTIAEALQRLPEILQEQARQQQIHRRATARMMNAIFEDLEARGLKVEDLPQQAQHLLWVLDSGAPIHPKQSTYLKGAILAAESKKAGSRE